MRIFKYQKSNGEMVYFKREKQKWEQDLLRYRGSNKHSDDCAAYGDGCLCCLDKEWIWKFIERIVQEKTK